MLAFCVFAVDVLLFCVCLCVFFNSLRSFKEKENGKTKFQNLKLQKQLFQIQQQVEQRYLDSLVL